MKCCWQNVHGEHSSNGLLDSICMPDHNDLYRKVADALEPDRNRVIHNPHADSSMWLIHVTSDVYRWVAVFEIMNMIVSNLTYNANNQYNSGLMTHIDQQTTR